MQQINDKEHKERAGRVLQKLGLPVTLMNVDERKVLMLVLETMVDKILYLESQLDELDDYQMMILGVLGKNSDKLLGLSKNGKEEYFFDDHVGDVRWTSK